jgi:hypothetical protein
MDAKDRAIFFIVFLRDTVILDFNLKNRSHWIPIPFAWEIFWQS